VIGTDHLEAAVGDLGFDVQKAKGHKDAYVGVEWAVGQCVDAVLEPKYDGWRGIAVATEGGVRIYNRSRKEYTGQLPEVEAEFAKLPVGTIVDGEIVALSLDTETGRFDNDWSCVQTAMTTHPDGPKAPKQKIARRKVQFVAFDVIARGDVGQVTHLPQQQRREMLEDMLTTFKLDTALVQLTAQFDATQESHDKLVAVGFEGSIVKCRDSIYKFGARGHGWFKFKGTVTIDVVIMELPVNGKGQHENKVGHMVVGQIKGGELIQRTQVNAPNNTERTQMTNNPQDFIGRVAEIKVYGWSADDMPRHPTFLRWRTDKQPTECEWNNG
jgi:ATP-dependent DNA ligase